MCCSRGSRVNSVWTKTLYDKPVIGCYKRGGVKLTYSKMDDKQSHRHFSVSNFTLLRKIPFTRQRKRHRIPVLLNLYIDNRVRCVLLKKKKKKTVFDSLKVWEEKKTYYAVIVIRPMSDCGNRNQRR